MKIAKLSSSEKILIGAVGGLAAVCVKFLGQDYTIILHQGANLTADQWFAYQVGYGILTPILIFLGMVLAWVSDESSRVKLLAIAIAAPAMITTWSGGVKSNDNMDLASFSIISTAHAAGQQNKKTTLSRVDPTKRSDKTWWSAAVDGVKMFFGYGKEINRFYVVAGSFKSHEQALAHSKAINNRDKSYQAHAGPKTSNDYYPVLLGEADTLSNANRLRKKIIGRRIIKDAYLVNADDLKSRMSFSFLE